MTFEQEKHLLRIQNSFISEVEKKYRKGQEEHGGDLSDLTPIQLVNHAIDEAIDQYVYLHTLREQLINANEARVAQKSPTSEETK